MANLDNEKVASLVMAIQLFADCPSARHEESFLRAFRAADELAFEIGEPNLAAEDREVVLSAADHMTMMSTPLGGQRFMLAFASREIAGRMRPECLTFGAISIAEACRMVLRTDLGGIVIQAGTGDAAWGAVTRQAIAEMLD
jgi:hypothetical protein